MAVYIDDTGGYGFDAQLIGVEDTAWSRNTTDNCVWFSSTGTCETGLTLPNSAEWIVYEVYENDAQANDLTGGTNVYAWIEYTTTIGTIATTLSTWYTAWDSEATTRGYTTYSVKATHYKGSDLADVYDADDTGTFGTATTTNGTYTGHGSEWVLSDALLADTVSSSGTEYLLNGDFELGDNGDWFLYTGVTIPTDNLHFNTDSNQAALQTMPSLIGSTETMTFEYEVISYTSGVLKMAISGSDGGTIILNTSVGVHSVSYDVTNNTAGNMYVYGGNAGIGGVSVLDNISLIGA